jgi:2-oxoglutarate ferredoxin oxidoreductase subunit alpha
MAKILMKGAEAIAEAAIQAGCDAFFGYPITPQNEVPEYFAKMMPKLGRTFVQAESEVAAINMVLGAAAAGVRTMTSSSSPGVSLKSEGVSYIAGSDLPALIINVQRGGPGLGGIQPSQSDYWQATKALGHGDFQMFVLAPSTIQEMVDFVPLAFEVGEKYRVPSMILSDGMLGQMMEPVEFPEKKDVEVADKPWAANGHQNKRAKNIINSLYIEPEVLENLVIIGDVYVGFAAIKTNLIIMPLSMCKGLR